MLDTGQLAAAYLDIKEYLVRVGYADEIDWQADVCFEDTTESDFLREAAWVVLSAGFRESVLRRHFHRISEAFLCWCSAAEIVAEAADCRRRAMSVFAHSRKIEAIAEICDRVARCGFREVKGSIRTHGVGFLQELPFVGPVTSHHLAKNLGMDIVKPDRHLTRIARVAGYESPREMCSQIVHVVGDTLGVVDLVLWRYATLDRRYTHRFVGT